MSAGVLALSRQLQQRGEHLTITEEIDMHIGDDGLYKAESENAVFTAREVILDEADLTPEDRDDSCGHKPAMPAFSRLTPEKCPSAVVFVKSNISSKRFPNM